MNDYGYSEEHQPLTWWHGHPIYLAHLVVLGWIAAMLVTTIVLWSGNGAWLSALAFVSERVLAGEFWRIFTYGFAKEPSLWFVIEMAMIVWFGREVERFFGRRTFLRFYFGLYFFLPALFTLIGLWRPMILTREAGAFGLFLAFATLHPNVAMFFNVLAKWVAMVLVGIYTLMALSRNDLTGLISLWATVGFSVAFVRHAQGRFELPRFRWPARKPKFRVLPGGVRDSAPSRPRTDAAMAEIDALLDKIARSGIASLSPQERAKLEHGREEIRRRNADR